MIKLDKNIRDFKLIGLLQISSSCNKLFKIKINYQQLIFLYLFSERYSKLAFFCHLITTVAYVSSMAIQSDHLQSYIVLLYLLPL